MKNLTAHKKIVAAHRARNRCNEAMFKELERRFSPILAASQERWDGMLRDLRLQRSNYSERRFNSLYPMLSYEAMCDRHGKAYVDEHIDDLILDQRINCDVATNQKQNEPNQLN
jgi:hypothetical protein